MDFGVSDVSSLTPLDVNNDGHMDIVVGRSAPWPGTVGSRFGPVAEDAWLISSLEIVDLNLDGNLDLLYSAVLTHALSPDTHPLH